MAGATPTQRAFAGGELDPSLHQRVDTVRYATAAKTIRNFRIMKHGGLRTRDGSSYLTLTKDSSRQSRALPFIYGSSVLSNFTLEFGHQYIRFIQAGYYPVLEDYQDIVSITDASPGVFEVTAHGFANGDDVVLDGTFPVGMRDEVDGGFRQFRVRNVTANTFTLEYRDGPNAGSALSTLPWDLSGYASGEAQVARVYTLTTTYQESELFDVQYAQQGSTVTLTHPSHPIRELTWDGTTWALTAITTAPGTAAPTGLAASGAGGAGPARSYRVTAIADETLEESLPTASVNATAANDTLTWNQVAGAIEYNIYGYGPQGWGLMAIVDEASRAAGGWTIDATISPDIANKFPLARTPFNAAGDYPAVCGYIQQRQVFAASDSDPEKCWLSKSGFYKNFSIRSPIQDDDAVTFVAAGSTRNRIRHALDLGRLVLLTESTEKRADGAGDGVLTPTAVNLRSQTYFGASKVKPVVVGDEAIYVQSRSAILRTIGFNYQGDGYTGKDLSIFSNHLFEGYTVVEMAYQQMPHSTIWVVRSDGVLLGLTYIKEHDIWGWHRHDTAGFFESICVVPFGNDDVLYAVVRRTINGETVRYFEAIESATSTRQCGMDAASGRTISDAQQDALQTITLTGGVNWDQDEQLTCTITTLFGGALFPEEDALYYGFVIVHPEHGMVRLAVEGWTSPTEFTVRADRAVPAAFQGVSTATVDDTLNYLATKRLRGLWHLEGEDVAIVASETQFERNQTLRIYESFQNPVVLASPNNPSYETKTVTNGVVDLDALAVAPRVGLPYLCDLETLDIDNRKGDLMDKQILVTAVTLRVKDARGIWCGPQPPEDDEDDPTQGLDEAKLRNAEGYDEAVDLFTGKVEVGIDGSWNSNGRVFVRQVDPLEMEILSVSPHITVGGGR